MYAQDLLNISRMYAHTNVAEHYAQIFGGDTRHKAPYMPGASGRMVGYICGDATRSFEASSSYRVGGAASRMQTLKTLRATP